MHAVDGQEGGAVERLHLAPVGIIAADEKTGILNPVMQPRVIAATGDRQRRAAVSPDLNRDPRRLARAGAAVQVSLVNQEWKTYLETKKQGQFDVGRAGWIADYNEASSMLDLMQTTHGNNDGKYSNPTFDKLMSESRNQVDAEARNKLYVQAEEILAKDMPIAPIYQYVTSRMVKPYVGGYPANPLDNLYSKDMYISAR